MARVLHDRHRDGSVESASVASGRSSATRPAASEGVDGSVQSWVDSSPRVAAQRHAIERIFAGPGTAQLKSLSTPGVSAVVQRYPKWPVGKITLDGVEFQYRQQPSGVYYEAPTTTSSATHVSLHAPAVDSPIPMDAWAKVYNIRVFQNASKSASTPGNAGTLGATAFHHRKSGSTFAPTQTEREALIGRTQRIGADFWQWYLRDCEEGKAVAEHGSTGGVTTGEESKQSTTSDRIEVD